MKQRVRKKGLPRADPTRADSRAIVDAIIEVASSTPISELTMRVLADRAGVGLASVYRYFPSKAVIYAEIARRLHARFVADVRAVLDSDPPLNAALEGVCHAAVVGQGTDLRLRAELNLDVPQRWTHEVAATSYAQIIELLLSYLQRTQPAAPSDMRARVYWIFAALRGQLLFHLVHHELGTDPAAAIAEMKRTALLLLQAEVGG